MERIHDHVQINRTRITLDMLSILRFSDEHYWKVIVPLKRFTYRTVSLHV